MGLKELRENAGLLQSQVAEKLEVTQAAVSRWETGDCNICRKYQKKLAVLYGVSVDELLKGGKT